ncbi:MAG: hypothetical protein WCP87_05300, partial [Atribacterota bacterium]
FRAFQQQNREERRKMEQDLYFFLTESRQRVIKKQSARCLSVEIVREKTLLEKKWTGLQGHPLFQENPGQMEKSEHEIQRRLGEIRLQKNSLNEQKNSCQQELSRIETSSEYIGSEIGTLRKEIVGIDSTAQSVTTRIEGAEKSMGGFQTDLDQLLGQEQVLQKKINRKKSLLQAAQQKLATYDQEGQVDDDIVQIMKQLLRMGWPGKALYALTWLFRGQRLFQSENQSHLHDDTLSGSGRGYLWDIFIPPSFYWEICSREKILDLFLSSSLPEVNFISPDGHLVYRRDGALIFPRKMVVKGRGGTFYQSFGKKINLLKSSLVRDEQSIQTFFSCQKSIETQLIQKKSELDGLKLRSDDLAREKKKRTDRVELLLKRKKEIDNEKESVGEELARVEETVEKMDEDLTQGEEELVDLQRRIRDRQKLQAAEEKLSLEMVNWEKKQQEIETVLQGIEKNAGSFLDLIHDLRSRFQQNEIRWVGTQEQEHNLENEIKEQEESRKKYQTIWGEKNNEKQTLIRKSEKITLQKEKFTFERDELTRQYQGFIQE